MHKQTSAPVAPRPQHHYLSKPGGGGAGGCRIQRPGTPPSPWGRVQNGLLSAQRGPSARSTPRGPGAVGLGGAATRASHAPPTPHFRWPGCDPPKCPPPPPAWPWPRRRAPGRRPGPCRPGDGGPCGRVGAVRAHVHGPRLGGGGGSGPPNRGLPAHRQPLPKPRRTGGRVPPNAQGHGAPPPPGGAPRSTTSHARAHGGRAPAAPEGAHQHNDRRGVAVVAAARGAMYK